MAEKIYLGSGKKVGQYGNIAVSVCLEDLQPHAKKSEKNGKHYVNLIVSELKTPNQWGKTHSVYLDEWQPNQPAQKSNDQLQEESVATVQYGEEPEQIRAEDIPF